MIVKNEQRWIRSVLESVKHIVDEMIVVDTGSTDGTPDIARQLGASVYSFTWCDDFSAARNFSVDKAQGGWIIFLDADEIIEPADAAGISPLCGENNLAGYFLIQRNYTNDVRRQNFVPCTGAYETGKYARGFIPVNRIGIFRNRPEIRFSGIIHETVGPAIAKIGGVVGQTNIVVHHFGHLENEIREQKTDYYLRLGLKQIEITPDDPKPYYDVAVVYSNKGDFVQAEKFFLKTIELNDEYEDVLFNTALLYVRWHKFDKALEYLGRSEQKAKLPGKILLTRGIVYDCMQNFNLACQTFTEGMHLYPDNPAFIENTAFSLLKTGQFKQAEQMFRQLVDTYPAQSKYRTGLLQAVCLQGNWDTARSVIADWEHINVFDPSFLLISLQVYLELNEWSALARGIAKLERTQSANPQTLFYKGVLEEINGNLKQALLFYKQALIQTPQYAEDINRRMQKLGL